ncbi:hypothetical protein AVEN_193088-1 [Araneus ventricosus]|uniref:Uncharacterized protein n=1 Tax=Araneus ventricosus TaxID=182803 RepID=A0A4Y2B0T5_ARAVE|nr:hypothetical protein AVEN_193088-1 [Araneus ventricosus]
MMFGPRMMLDPRMLLDTHVWYQLSLSTKKVGDQIKGFNSEDINLQALVDMDRLPKEARGASTIDVTHIVRLVFVILLGKVPFNLAPRKLIRFLFHQGELDKPISTHLMPVSEMTMQRLISGIIHVIQSKVDMLLGEGFDIEVITIRRSVGARRTNRREVIPSLDRIRKSSIISPDLDKYGVCCARAILIALSRLDKHPDNAALRRKNCSILLRKALSLHEETGVKIGLVE